MQVHCLLESNGMRLSVFSLNAKHSNKGDVYFHIKVSINNQEFKVFRIIPNLKIQEELQSLITNTHKNIR